MRTHLPSMSCGWNALLSFVCASVISAGTPGANFPGREHQHREAIDGPTASKAGPQCRVADLVLTKDASPDPVTAGTPLVYTLTVINLGPCLAKRVVVTEFLPANVVFHSTSGCAEDPAGVPTCTLDAIDSGDFDAYTITVVVDPGSSGVIVNSADVTSNNSDPDPGNNAASNLTAINRAPEVTIHLPMDGSTFGEGLPISFLGTATDPEDGDLTSSLIWTSNRDGDLETGGSFMQTLTLGGHEVTAAVTDSGGATATDSVSIGVISLGEPEPIGDISVDLSLDDQSGPSVAADAMGNFVVVFASSYSSDSDTDGSSVMANLFDSGGISRGRPFQVNTYTMSHQQNPAVARQKGGGFVVVWQSDGSYDTDSCGMLCSFSIQGQRFDADGDPIDDEFQVNTYITSNQTYPAVAIDGGRFVVVWQSEGTGADDTDTDGYSIQGRRFDSEGTLRDQFQVNSATTGDQTRPKVAFDVDGEFLVVWQTDGAGTNGGYSVRGRRFDAGGNPDGDEFALSTETNDEQHQPTLAGKLGGGFVAVWQSDTPPPAAGGGQLKGERRFRIRGGASRPRRRIRGPGDLTPFEVAESSTVELARPVLAVNRDDDFVVVWQRQEGLGSIAGRTFFDLENQPAVSGREFTIAGGAKGGNNTELPAVVYTTGSEFGVTWQQAEIAGLYKDVQGQRYESPIPPLPPSGMPFFADGFEAGDTAAWDSTVP